MNKKLKLGLVLFSLGLLGILSLLTVPLSPENIPEEVLKTITPQTLKYLSLINPTVLLIISTIVGTLLHDKVKLTVPAISSLLKVSVSIIKFKEQFKSGVLFGLVPGVLTFFVAHAFEFLIPQEFMEIGNTIRLNTLVRFLYGGITEELLMRYGFMTLIVWITFKTSKKLNRTTYWIGIILSTLLFAVGHFPVVFSSVSNPSSYLLLYVLIGNSIAGLFFGWLYWKKGLESAIIAHIFFHVAMISFEVVNSI